MARRNQAGSESMKSQVEETKGELEDLKKNQLDITAGNLQTYYLRMKYQILGQHRVVWGFFFFALFKRKILCFSYFHRRLLRKLTFYFKNNAFFN